MQRKFFESKGDQLRVNKANWVQRKKFECNLLSKSKQKITWEHKNPDDRRKTYPGSKHYLAKNEHVHGQLDRGVE